MLNKLVEILEGYRLRGFEITNIDCSSYSATAFVEKTHPALMTAAEHTVHRQITVYKNLEVEDLLV